MTSLRINFQERRDVSYEGGTLYVSSYIRPRRMIRILYDSHMTMTISRSRSRTVQDSILRFFFKKRDIWFNLAIYGSHMTIICEEICRGVIWAAYIYGVLPQNFPMLECQKEMQVASLEGDCLRVIVDFGCSCQSNGKDL